MHPFIKELDRVKEYFDPTCIVAKQDVFTGSHNSFSCIQLGQRGQRDCSHGLLSLALAIFMTCFMFQIWNILGTLWSAMYIISQSLIRILQTLIWSRGSFLWPPAYAPKIWDGHHCLMSVYSSQGKYILVLMEIVLGGCCDCPILLRWVFA